MSTMTTSWASTSATLSILMVVIMVFVFNNVMLRLLGAVLVFDHVMLVVVIVMVIIILMIMIVPYMVHITMRLFVFRPMILLMMM